MVGGALLMHAISLALPHESLADVTWNGTSLLALGYLAVVSSAGGFLLYFALLERLGPIEVNLVSYVAPAVAAVVGWLLLGETVDALTVGGFVTIATGFALIKRRALAQELATFGST